jgi:ribosomal protein L14E/L6E/L27E
MVGQIVCSKAGRDKGNFLVVVLEKENTVFVCDGKERPLERPKLKNPKHLCFTNTVLSAESFRTNKSLRKALAIYRDSVN